MDVRLQVQDHMDVKERAHDFCFTFEDDKGHDEQVWYLLIYHCKCGQNSIRTTVAQPSAVL